MSFVFRLGKLRQLFKYCLVLRQIFVPEWEEKNDRKTAAAYFGVKLLCKCKFGIRRARVSGRSTHVLPANSTFLTLLYKRQLKFQEDKSNCFSVYIKMTFGILFNSEGCFLSFSQASFFWPSLESRSSLAVKVHIIRFSSFSNLLRSLFSSRSGRSHAVLPASIA